jgi:hypothetical protein
VKVNLHTSLQARLSDHLFKILVVEVLSLQVAVGRDGPRGSRHDDILCTLEVLGDFVKESLP